MDKYMRESLDFTQRPKSSVQLFSCNMICSMYYNTHSNSHLSTYPETIDTIHITSD